MRGFTITAAIGAAAFAIHGVSGAALPIGGKQSPMFCPWHSLNSSLVATNLNANLEKRDALAGESLFSTLLWHFLYSTLLPSPLLSFVRCSLPESHSYNG